MPQPRPSARIVRVGTTGAACSLVLGLAGQLTMLLPAQAFFDAPAPKVDCSKRENRSKPQCKESRVTPRPSDTSDEIFFAAYGLARAGQYAAAREILRLGDQSDPRVLNYTGFVTRKLGAVDAALPYYRRALDLDPDYVLARAYLGEAFLQKDELELALGELGEIERRCGRACAEYVELGILIETHRMGARNG